MDCREPDDEGDGEHRADAPGVPAAENHANIVEGNALRMDWESVVPEHKLSYIMGNPPFVVSP